MTNLSTSEVLGKYAPQFVELDVLERECNLPTEHEAFDAEARKQGRALLDFCAELLVENNCEENASERRIETLKNKLERAKEALREINKACFVEGATPFENWLRQFSEETLAYIEEGKE